MHLFTKTLGLPVLAAGLLGNSDLDCDGTPYSGFHGSDSRFRSTGA